MGGTKTPDEFPHLRSDKQAERFVESADLTKYDLSNMKPIRFELPPIALAERRRLKTELKRAGVTVIALLKGADDLPDGVSARAVNRWISGLAQPERQSQFDYVLGKLRALPDATTGPRGHVAGRPGRRHPRLGEEWIEVTTEMRVQLRTEFTRTGLRFDTVLESAVDVPEGLTARVVRGWLYDHAKATRVAHWEFVMRRLNAAPNGGPLSPLARTR